MGDINLPNVLFAVSVAADVVIKPRGAPRQRMLAEAWNLSSFLFS